MPLVCRTYANFLCMVPILRRFRIVRCNRQAALHWALVNYTPLVIRGTSKNKQLTIIKPTQTGINRNKWTFCTIKSLEPLKKFKHQPCPLVRSSSLKFGQNFWNLSHETIPLSDIFFFFIWSQQVLCECIQMGKLAPSYCYFLILLNILLQIPFRENMF